MKRMTLALIAAVAWAALAGSTTDPTALASLFPQLQGWRMEEKTELFLPETLYEHINGAAENFLNYDFSALAVRNYRCGEKSLSAEIYFHGKPENAFGIYSSEKPLAGDYITVGAQGYVEEGVLNFFSGAYYVKLNGFDLGPEGKTVLTALARGIAAAIGDENALPAVLDAFPVAGKQAHSERFILNNFLGHDFLGSAYVADYQADGRNFQLFVIQAASEDHARRMLEKYAALDKALAGKEMQFGKLTVNDPYNGPMQLVWQGRFICGSNSPAAGALLTELTEKLTQ